MAKRLKFRQRLDRYPPILVRLLATRGGRRNALLPTDEEIADTSGLPLATVKLVAYSLTWDGIPVDVMFRFLAACDIDLEKHRCLRRLEWMRRHGQFTHLKRDPLWRSVYEPMVAMLPE